MGSARHFSLVCISIAMLAACGKSEVSPPSSQPAGLNAPESRPAIDKTIVQTDTYPQLAEEIVDPDVNEALTSDEDVVDGIEPEPVEAVVLDGIPGEVTFQIAQTSSLRATDAQTDFAGNVERHNREKRLQASLASSEQPTASVSSAASPANKLATQAPAIDEKKILADPKGQWAATAVASSTYAQTTGEKAGYAAWQATGKPNVPRYADHPSAWTSKSGDAKAPEWLELGFANPVHATSVRIRQTAAPGAVSKIELIDTAGAAHEIWSGTDDTPYQKDTIGWLIKDFPRTEYAVKGTRITLLTARVWGWNEIDAVQLVGEP